MIVHILFGAACMAAFWFLWNRARKLSLSIRWWQWALAILEIIYSAFVLELIFGFLQEGVPQAALVMGLITGLFAVIGGVLLGRFVFTRSRIQPRA